MSGHLRGMGCIMVQKLGPDGRYDHQMGMFSEISSKNVKNCQNVQKMAKNYLSASECTATDISRGLRKNVPSFLCLGTLMPSA